MIVSKSELAEELDVSPARITQYVRTGMPVRPDSKIDLRQACRWLVDNLDSGSGRARGHANEWLHLLNR